MQTQVPMKLRPHLIPFFFEEMQGIIAAYAEQKVNMIRLYPTSSLANYIYTQIGYEKNAQGRDLPSFLLYLSIEKNKITTLSGTIYLDEKGIKSELLLDVSKVRAINNLLEDIFRNSMVTFVDGFKAAGKPVRHGVNYFMDRYSLEEYGFERETLRMMYNREKENKLLNRLQKRSSNQVINFF
jgi:hypothetical protein